MVVGSCSTPVTTVRDIVARFEDGYRPWKGYDDDYREGAEQARCSKCDHEGLWDYYYLRSAPLWGCHVIYECPECGHAVEV